MSVTGKGKRGRKAPESTEIPDELSQFVDKLIEQNRECITTLKEQRELTEKTTAALIESNKTISEFVRQIAAMPKVDDMPNYIQ